MPNANANDLRGANRLLVDAVAGTTDLVEAVHASILQLPRRIAGLPSRNSTGGIAGLVYSTVRGIARVAGTGMDLALQRLPATDADAAPNPRREALIAVLNGVVGDRLAETGNPLAITARLRQRGRALALQPAALAKAFPDARPRILVMVHGLCMNDLQWRQGGHHHGVMLARELGYDLVHLHYNTGLSIAANGRQRSALLQSLTDVWPVAIERIAIVGHSMGGLVARAAITAAQADASPWLGRLDTLTTLGTPHLGAPLERAGHLLEGLLGISAHSAPFRALGRMRSAGIQELRHGSAHATHPPLPAHVRVHLVAGSLQPPPRQPSKRHPRGDGLVPVASAFGEHPDPRRRLPVAGTHKLLVHATGHLALLGSNEVHARLQHWLA